MIDNQPKKTKAYIAGVNLNDPNFDYYMTELANLTEAAAKLDRCSNRII